MMKVVNVMTTHPVSVAPEDSIQQVREIMDEEKIRQLPVTKEKELLGIITDRDIRSFLGGRSLSYLEEQEVAMKTKVATVMTDKPITLSPDNDLREAVELLLEEKVGGIPVMDPYDGLMGIITYVDVLRCFLEQWEE
ncbi:MAG: CBS domain-containing protein [Deltaproteobacteria bacterium]|nr:CBS domain-containing protein [Deltaproteobacteria bacterium]